MSADCATPATCPQPSDCWCLSRPLDFDLCHFDDGAVLHDDLGGSVIQFSPVAGELLRLLMIHSSGVDVPFLARSLLGDELEEHDPAAVENLLQGLRSQGLVERRSL